MRVIASAEATDLIRERGGRLYVRLTRDCCGGVTRLAATSEPADGATFRQVPAEGIELYVPEHLARLPDELHLEARGVRRRRVEAYWDGCAWVT